MNTKGVQVSLAVQAGPLALLVQPHNEDDKPSTIPWW